MNRAQATDIVVALERSRAAEARAFVVVTVDQHDRAVVHATGPFPEAEQALAQAGRDAQDWRRHAGPGEGDFDHVVVPLWEPSG